MSPHKCVKAVLNLSKQQLINSEEAELNKDLKFTITIKWLPYLDVIDPIEEAALRIAKPQADL